MATTKSAQYQFKVKEGPCDPFVLLEPAGRPPAAGWPLKDLDLASFTLRPGISLDEAEQIADFLNQNLVSFAITSFGDAQDTDRELRLSERRRGIEHERFSLVLAGLKEALATGNIDSALDATKAVEAVALSMSEEWGQAVRTSRAILKKQMENHDVEK
jgi:hypothetical protein